MKRIFLMALAAALVCGCEKTMDDSDISDNSEQSVSDGSTVSKTKKFTFTLKGDFSSDWETRGYLQADGKDLTDVWVLDYMNGALVQQLHQDDNTTNDFGKPVLQLAYGSHHIYFLASRGSSATLNTDAHTITFGKVLDTFYKDYEVSVVSTSNGNRAVALDRIVTRLKLTFTDAISDDAATINITPHTWYYAWDYVNATPAGAATDQTSALNIPASDHGKTGVFASLYGFSTEAEWTTDVSINSKKSDNTVIGSATLTDVPFQANRSTDYSGPLFGTEGETSLSLNSTWNTSYEGTW